jgi:hypothetical protein
VAASLCSGAHPYRFSAKHDDAQHHNPVGFARAALLQVRKFCEEEGKDIYMKNCEMRELTTIECDQVSGGATLQPPQKPGSVSPIRDPLFPHGIIIPKP